MTNTDMRASLEGIIADQENEIARLKAELTPEQEAEIGYKYLLRRHVLTDDSKARVDEVLVDICRTESRGDTCKAAGMKIGLAESLFSEPPRDEI